MKKERPWWIGFKKRVKIGTVVATWPKLLQLSIPMKCTLLLAKRPSINDSKPLVRFNATSTKVCHWTQFWASSSSTLKDSMQSDSSSSSLFQTSHHPPSSVEDADSVSQVAADCRCHLPPTATPWQLMAAQAPPHPVTYYTVITIWLTHGTRLSYSGRRLCYNRWSHRWLL